MHSYTDATDLHTERKGDSKGSPEAQPKGSTMSPFFSCDLPRTHLNLDSPMLRTNLDRDPPTYTKTYLDLGHTHLYWDLKAS